MSWSSGSRGLYDPAEALPEEHDYTDRNAAFYLYTHPVQSSAILKESDDRELHHWILVAYFKDKSIRAMEASEVNGVLEPTFNKETPKERNGKLWDLKTPVITSPKKLLEVTKKNNLNKSTYSALSNNCQNWVKEAASSISNKLFDALKNYKTNGEVGFFVSAAKSSWAASKASSNAIACTLHLKSQETFESETAEHHKKD